jgi:hypothetical protein
VGASLLRVAMVEIHTSAHAASLSNVGVHDRLVAKLLEPVQH